MNAYCAPIIELSEVKKNTTKETRIFRAWKERWEMKELTSDGDVSHEAHLVCKYGGLTWLDPDNGDKIIKYHANEMQFQKQQSKNNCCDFAYSEKYDLSIPSHTQEDEMELWELEDDFYKCMTKYYKDREGKNVVCFQKDDDCGSYDEIETHVPIHLK